MSARDAFQEGRDSAERRRSDLDAVREDVRAIVRAEVARAGMSAADLERLVAELMEKRAARASGLSRWPASAWVAIGVAGGVVAGALGYGMLVGGDPIAGSAETGISAVGVEVPAGVGLDPGVEAMDPALEAPVSPAPSAEDRAATYDSIFDARSGLFDPLISELEASAIAVPVSEAIQAWRGGGGLTVGQERRLHDGLLQLTVSELTGVALALDGLVTRGPCSGSSCGALLDLWSTRGEELSLPPFPEDAANDAAAVSVVERLLLLRRLEGGDG